jgi:hypothetical protein
MPSEMSPARIELAIPIVAVNDEAQNRLTV